MKYSLELIDVPSEGARKLQSRYAYWHDPEFMAALADLHSVRAMQLQVFKGEELLAILPLYERRKIGLKALVTPSGTYYQGICFNFEEASKPSRVSLDTTAICIRIASFMAEKYKWINFRLNPDNADIRGFSWAGYRVTVLYTFRQFIGSELCIMPDERKKMRQARKLGMKLIEDFDLDAFFHLQEELEKRKKHSLGIPHSRIKDFFARLYEKGLLKQFNIYQDSQVVSSNILYSDNGEVAYTVNMATSAEAMRQGAAIYHSLALASHLPKNTKILDFCGANIKEVSRFKAALGLDLHSFYHIKL
ncbi:MAG: hypothetical protein RBR69_01880 [Candidatus Cloacimonadaceae bacterium]|jgi:hypothetical protein|nr:hypothetical protein [Candidatus Cloacimonadota bacterium]MDY0126874.1 hypothetical protein [Candidatus Cloacimonadaceae bacterium]MCB5254678.1 hypothetical protein [Candidatus Cloacimonadota bacterium]MCK9178644.1 hypothetical protein [Candidatus Cloacimonadota bacterium]MCK9241786.1 hypothetical protein [Candidatus Cloacimonadota bacterium]